SIMPAKVNPVIPEAVSQAAMAVMANDVAIAHAAASGSLELNPFLPLIADALLANLGLLANANSMFRRLCVEGIEANEARCRQNVNGASAILTALVEKIGHEMAQSVARSAAQEGRTVREILLSCRILSAAQIDELTSAENVTKLGSAPPPAGKDAAEK
ncbi:MAG: aspartate ammonia-lyase, partial [Phycisphaerae bacterium]|nr:aspartate ammonia-lyase [Phycisphaerae bacterium]